MGRWVDGNSLRIRVVAWRRLAEGVASSITVGDPVIIYGRLYTRDWKDDKGNNRISYEMEASSIGHDLARGRAKFFRTKATQDAGMIDHIVKLVEAKAAELEAEAANQATLDAAE